MRAPRRPRARPRMGTVFVLLGLLVFMISGAGLVVFRIYDNQLVRQTESELIAQAALVAAMYEQALLRRLGHQDAAMAGHPASPEFVTTEDDGSPLRPLPPRLALGADEVRPPAEAARPAMVPFDADAMAAGADVQPVLQQTKRVTLAGIRLVDAGGIVVATSNAEAGLSLAHREEVARALKGEHVSLLRRRISDEPPPAYGSLSRETGVRVFVAEPVLRDGRVLGAAVLSRTPMTLGKAFYQDRFNLLATAGILVAAVLAVSLLASALVVRPVRALIRQSEAIAAADNTVATGPIAHPGTREIAQLSEAFARMSTRLGERSEYIRGFAASVSHEFKTPLTAIRGTVELLRDHGDGMQPSERERFLSNLSDDAERLDRLVRRVLELARADMLEPGRERAELARSIEHTVSRFREGGIAVAVEGASDCGAVRMAPETLEAILCSLLDNARQHGGPSVRVQLSARRSGTGELVELDVRDDGPGISAANASRVFEPFFTTSRDRGGTGMGLTIVRALLHAHGGSIELLPGGPGACFRLTVPADPAAAAA